MNIVITIKETTMSNIRTIKTIKKISKEFEKTYGNIQLAAILKEDNRDILLFSSKYLDPMSPLDATYKVTKFFRSYDKNILNNIDSIIVIHTEDDNIKNNRFNEMDNVYIINVKE